MKSQAFVAVTGLNNKVENRLVTIGEKTTHLDGEANLTFDGSTLALTGNQTISGNLTVSGTTTSVQTTNTVIKDQLIELGNGRSGSASGDAGIIVERGSDTNAAIIFDESEDLWKVCTTAATGASTGDLTLTDAALKAAAITSSGVVTATGFTIGSAVIAESELEQIDGITAGTVAASKAMVVDANLDISGARNVTISGELDAASLDISGDADIDGTLEADAITVGGVALAASALTDTTNASNIGSGTLPAARTAAAQTEVTSITNTGLVVGRDADNQIKFGTDNNIIFRVSGGDGVTMKASGEIEATSLDISGDVDVDGTLEADAITLGGVSLAASATTDTTNGSNIASGTVNAARMDATQTALTSITNAALVVGRDADNQIKFSTDDQVIFRVAGGDGVIFKASGEIEATSLDISGDADIDGTLEADAITVGGTALGEVIADTVGAMVGSNTETGITVSYDDSDNTLDFVLAAVGTNAISDNAVTLDKLAGIARGKIIYGDANGDPAVLAPGSNGQVLTSDGTDVSWQNASGGGGSAADDSNTILHMQVFA